MKTLNERSNPNQASDSDEDFFGSGFIDNESDDESSNEEAPSKKQRNLKRRKDEMLNGTNFEEEYMKKLQEKKEDEESEAKKKRYLLPVKSGKDLIHRVGMVEEITSEEKKAKKYISKKEYYAQEEEDSDIEIDEGTSQRDLSVPVSTAELVAWREKALAKCRFQIGLLASTLLENPQQNIKNLKTLNKMADKKRRELSYSVKKLVFVSMAEIFKDIIPAYQIKHNNPAEVRLKKETYQLQNYETALLKNYRDFLTKLEKCISVFIRKNGDKKVDSKQTIDLGLISVNILCDLLHAHPYFNYSENIAQLLILYLNNPRSEVRKSISNCLFRVFKEDKKGNITLFIVRKINKLVRKHSNAVHHDVVSVFLALKIKDINLDNEKEAEIKERKREARKQMLMTMSKNEKRARKRLKDMKMELMETVAEENKKTKQKLLTEVIKLVFNIYFRILKKDPSSKLLCTTLEGIAKFAQLINLDFYQDLVLVLSRLMNGGNLGLRQRLLCIQTIFAILTGHGESLTIDPTNFYTHLYRVMPSIHSGQTYEHFELLLDALEVVIINRRKRISLQRKLAFTKRLATLSLHLLHNGSLSCLALVKDALQMNRSVDLLLELDSSVGKGLFLPDLEDPEHCNAESTSMFELAALRRHYHPDTCKMAKHLIRNVPASGEGSLAPEIGKLSSKEIFHQYNPLEMIFKPSVPAPKPPTGKVKPHIVWNDSSLQALADKLSTEEFNINFSSLYEEVQKNGIDNTVEQRDNKSFLQKIKKEEKM